MKLNGVENRILCALFLLLLILSGIVFEQQRALAGSVGESEVKSGFPSISNTPSIIHLNLAEAKLFSRSGVSGSAYLSVAFEEIEYEYNQVFPNHIKGEMWPLVTSGLKVKF